MALEPPSDPMRRQFLRLGTCQPFRRGDLLMLEGTASDEVLMIESGAVNVVLSTPDGVQSIVGRYGPGELIGDIGVMKREPRSATVVGQQDGCAMRMSGEEFRALIKQDDGTLWQHMYEGLYRRLQKADRLRLALASLDVRGRVVAQLLDWAEDFGKRDGGQVVVPGMTQHQLAQVIAASRQAVEDVLSDLRSAGLLETGHKRFTLLRPDLLEEELRRSGWQP